MEIHKVYKCNSYLIVHDALGQKIKTHDSESRGQEEPATTE